MLKWDAENEDYEIVHVHTCPVMWYFGNALSYSREFGPTWEYECGVDYEVSHVGLASLEDMPDVSGTYELMWECEGGGDDFDSWLSVGEKLS